MPGMRQMYQLEIINKGDLKLTGLNVADELDKHLKYVSDTSSGKHSSNGREHRWTFNRTLQPAERFSFNIITKFILDHFIFTNAPVTCQISKDTALNIPYYI